MGNREKTQQMQHLYGPFDWYPCNLSDIRTYISGDIKIKPCLVTANPCYDLTHWTLGDMAAIFEVNFKLIIQNSRLGTCYDIHRRWMPPNLINEKSLLDQVMAWCRQATSHYLVYRHLYRHIWRLQGAVSIRKMVLPGVAIPMLKIRRPNGRLIFNIGIAIPR